MHLSTGGFGPDFSGIDFRSGLLPDEIRLIGGYAGALSLVGGDPSLLTGNDKIDDDFLIELDPGVEGIADLVRESVEAMRLDSYYLEKIGKDGEIPSCHRKTRRGNRRVSPFRGHHVLVGKRLDSSFLSTNHIRGWNIVSDNSELSLAPSALSAIERVYQMLRDLPYEEHGLRPLSISIEKLGHFMRTSVYASFLAEKAGVSPFQAAVSGFLHDMGKLPDIVDYVTEKESFLNSIERRIMELHPKIGAILLAMFIRLGYFSFSSEVESEVVNTAMTHHLGFDGGGYPRGIPLEKKSRISEMVSICDAFDAMTSGRTYQDRMSPENAIEELKRCSGLAWDRTKTRKQVSELQFDPELVILFIEMNLRPVFY